MRSERSEEPDPTHAPTSRPAGDRVGDRVGEASAWVAIDGIDGPVEQFEMHDLDLLAEITHPIRGPILRRLKEPRTVAEVAALLDVPVTRLYHHVNRLDERGLIRVVATRKVAAVTERRYQVAAKSYRVAHDLFDTADEREMSLALSSLFDVAKLDLQREVESGGFRDIADPAQHSVVSLGEVHVSPDRRHELIGRLNALVEEFAIDERESDDPLATRMTLFIAAFPSNR